MTDVQETIDRRRIPSVGREATDIGTDVDEIVEAWLTSLPRPTNGGGRSQDVVAKYRTLGRTVLRHGLSSEPSPEPPTLLEIDEVPGLDRALAAVAAANRKAGLRMSQTLEDVARLEVAALDWLRTRAAHGEGWRSSLSRTSRILLSLAGVTRRLVYVLEESALRAQRENAEALAAMTDMLSHELGNRLGAALTASEMLLGDDIELDEDGLVRAAELVRSSVDAALHTVDDVQALAASRSRHEEPVARALPLPHLIRSVVDRQYSAADEAGVAVEVAEDVVECRVDQARLRLIVFNLLANGIKYHDPDKDECRVRISAVGDGERVELSVADNGVGIPPEDLEDVFLYRIRGREAGSLPGSGLGLAIVREAVDQLEGEINVESEVGSGTTFTVLFRPLGGPALRRQR